MFARLVSLLALSLASPSLTACGDSDCIDADSDGRGAGCEAGPDCDDNDPAIRTSCEELPEGCLDEPFAAGCPCLAGTSRACYSGADGTEGVGACRGARQSCFTGAWAPCLDEVTPRFEQCNREDDDCDGVVDERVQSPCGGCNAECVGGVWGTETAPFEPTEGLDLTAIGELTLARTELESVTVWVPNSGDSSVSKIDASAAVEVARYRVAGAAAERLAVDYRGDAWVLSSAPEGRASLAKLAATRDRCIDREGDGLLSSAGPDDVLPIGSDECVLLELELGDDAEFARSLAVDGSAAPDAPMGGRVWVGMAETERLLELDGETGETLRTVQTPELSPHASVFDPWGALWVIDRAGKLARVDPAADPPKVEMHEVPLPCYELESITSDAQGALMLTGFACETVIAYDPRRDRWDVIETPGVLTTRGVEVLGADAWVLHTAGAVSRVARAPLAFMSTYPLAGLGVTPFESTEVARDSFGQLWFVSSQGGPDGVGLLTGFDPVDEEVVAQIPLGPHPRPLGDLAGTRRHGTFESQARTRHRFGGCSMPSLDPAETPTALPTEWKRVHVLWNAGVGSEVLVEARHAPEADALGEAEWIALGTLPADDPPFDVDFEPGGVVEVRLTLRVSGHTGAPRISQVGLEWRCPGPD